MSWTSKSVGRMQHRQQLRAAQAALGRAQSRLRKGGRRQWPFQPGEVETVSAGILAAAIAKIGPEEVARIEAEIARARQNGTLDKVRNLSDLSKLAEATARRLAKREAEDTTPNEAADEESTKAQVRAVEAVALRLIGATRDHAKKGGQR